MAVDLNHLIKQAQQLPAQQKLALIAAISSDMAEDVQLQDASEQFWAPQTLQDRLDAHPIEPVTASSQLRSHAWPQHDDLESFLEFIKTQRHTSLLQDQP